MHLKELSVEFTYHFGRFESVSHRIRLSSRSWNAQTHNICDHSREPSEDIYSLKETGASCESAKGAGFIPFSRLMRKANTIQQKKTSYRKKNKNREK